MDLAAEVEETERDLGQLQTALETFQSRSEATIRKEHASMFDELQKSVDSVKTTFLLVQAGNTLALGDIVPPKKSTAQKKRDQPAIRQHVTQMSEQFQALQASADEGLAHIQDIKKKSDDYEAELGEIEIRVASLLARSKTSLQNANKLLSEKTIAVKDASDTLSAQEKELSELDRKMESGEDQQKFAGSLAAAATVGSIMFLPMIFVAGGMAGWAISANSDRKRHEEQIGGLRTRHQSLQSEHDKLKKQKSALEKAATSTGELLSECKNLTSGTDRVRPLVEAKLQLYQDLKITTDDFVAWTSELNNQAESMEILGRSDRVLENGMQRIVDALVDTEHTEVRKICTPLLVHATNPPPGTVAAKPPQNYVTEDEPSSPIEAKVGLVITVIFVCIIFFIQLDLVRLCGGTW